MRSGGDMPVLGGLVILFCLAGGIPGCAFLRLQGCTKIATCGNRSVYSCQDDLVCADAEGNTIRSELISPRRNRCRVCSPE